MFFYVHEYTAWFEFNYRISYLNLERLYLRKLHTSTCYFLIINDFNWNIKPLSCMTLWIVGFRELTPKLATKSYKSNIQLIGVWPCKKINNNTNNQLSPIAFFMSMNNKNVLKGFVEVKKRSFPTTFGNRVHLFNFLLCICLSIS